MYRQRHTKCSWAVSTPALGVGWKDPTESKEEGQAGVWDLVCIVASPLTGWVTQGEARPLSEPQLPHPQKEGVELRGQQGFLWLVLLVGSWGIRRSQWDLTLELTPSSMWFWSKAGHTQAAPALSPLPGTQARGSEWMGPKPSPHRRSARKSSEHTSGDSRSSHSRHTPGPADPTKEEGGNHFT